MPIVVEAVGTVQAIASIQIKPRLDSQIMKVNVEEGALVKEGDLLFELDVAHAEGAARPDRGADPQGPGADRAGQARSHARRRSAGQGRRHGGDARHRTTAQKAAEAQLESDEAMRQNILAQLSYTEIRAPVSGRIGSIPNKAGTIVRVGDNTATAVLATINQVDPIFVAFAMPQVFLPDLRAAMAKGAGQGQRHRRRHHKQSGAMAFIENTVDPMTGTVTAKARIANANEGLWPGQFVKAEVVLGVEADGAAVAGAGRPARPAGALRLRRQGRPSPSCGRSRSSAPRAARRWSATGSQPASRSWSTASSAWSMAPPSRSQPPPSHAEPATGAPPRG